VAEFRNKEKENSKKEISNVLDELKRDSFISSQKDEKANS
jgi:Txe/YoeB family toxin of Txe-Axe toxin-antitoxin module